MPISHEFKYQKPETINKALKILSEYGNAARILAGGTDLVVKIKEGLEEPAVVIDIKGIEKFGKIVKKQDTIHIGAHSGSSSQRFYHHPRKEYQSLRKGFSS